MSFLDWLFNRVTQTGVDQIGRCGEPKLDHVCTWCGAPSAYTMRVTEKGAAAGFGAVGDVVARYCEQCRDDRPQP